MIAAMAHSILILNGPNLNLLGTREPETYGRESLSDIEARCRKAADSLSITVDFRQSNHEGELVDWIQQAPGTHAGIIINAGGFTHTSVAIMDALLAINVPIIELHLSNIYRREEFRHHSYVSRVARGVICGLGSHGYELALQGMKNIVEQA